jgi:large subunit ribosomal protein L31
MKQNLHPKWNHAAVVTCACGNTFTTGSQQDAITVDICSACHPFFTGEMKFVDRQGRVDKFMQKMSTASAKQAALAAKKKAKNAETPEEVEIKEEIAASGSDEPLSYKQILQNEQNKLKNVAKNKSEAAKAAEPAKQA